MTPAQARAEFPVLATSVYLNSNSMGATPRGARAAATAYFDVVERWRDEAYVDLQAEVEAYANDLATLVGAPRGSIALDVNVSTLFGRLLSCFDWRERPRAVTTDVEFPSAEVALRTFARYGCELVVVPARDGVSVDVDGVCAQIDERVRVVFVSHATFAGGSLTDLAPISRRVREVGALLLVDAYQSCGVLPIDVDALDVDVLFAGAHKWLCGAFDCAFAYVRPGVLTTLEPAATGWMATAEPFSFSPKQGFASGARRLAAGTPALLPALTSREGLRIVREVGIDTIRALSLSRTERIIERADRAGIEVVTPRAPERRAGIVTLRFAGSADVAASLVRAGFVCSHRNGLRVAPHFYNTDDEIDRFMDALIERARASGRAA